MTGSIIEVGANWFTLQTNGRQVGVISALTAAATKVTAENTPYVWGGGHGEAGVASTGIKGPGYNGHSRGFDCSGSVAAVLAGAGLWPAGGGVPADYGIIDYLRSEGLIARGVGPAPRSVTLYDDPGVHIFMNIDGRFFGTSDGSGGGDARGGAGWLDDSAWDASDPHFKKWHFLPSVLRASTSYGNDFTFQLPSSGVFTATKSGLGVSLGELNISDLLPKERVRVTYGAQGNGSMTVKSIAVISGGPVITPPKTTTTTTTTPIGVTTPTVTPPTVSTPTVTTPTSTTPDGTPYPSGSGSADGGAGGWGGGWWNPGDGSGQTPAATARSASSGGSSVGTNGGQTGLVSSRR